MSPGLKSFRDSIILVLESGYCIGSLLAMALHLILPEEEDPLVEKRELVPGARLYDPSVHPQTKLGAGKPQSHPNLPYTLQCMSNASCRGFKPTCIHACAAKYIPQRRVSMLSFGY